MRVSCLCCTQVCDLLPVAVAIMTWVMCCDRDSAAPEDREWFGTHGS